MEVYFLRIRRRNYFKINMQNEELTVKLKKQNLFHLSVILICFTGSISSLFYPYMEKVNIQSGDLHLPKIILGYDYEITTIILFTIAINFLLSAFIKNKFWTFSMSLITLVLVYLTRIVIHSNNNIDHDFDSKTGVGYLILFIFSLVLFLSSSFSLVYYIRNHKTLHSSAKK